MAIYQYQAHPIFEEPPNENAVIWRYMDFAKFLSLLDSRSLFFSRADRLGDPFEGSYPDFNLRLRPTLYKNFPALPEILSQSARLMPRHTFVNCWNLSDVESAALWDQYGKGGNAVAIRSTFRRLTECLPRQRGENEIESGDRLIHVGKVKYIDYLREWAPEGNLYYPFLHKRKSFEHENEVRAITFVVPYIDNNLDWSKPVFEYGLNVSIDLGVLVDEIYVSPLAPSWLKELVKSVAKKYGLNKKPKRSDLDRDPVY